MSVSGILSLLEDNAIWLGILLTACGVVIGVIGLIKRNQSSSIKQTQKGGKHSQYIQAGGDIRAGGDIFIAPKGRSDHKK